MGHIIKDMCENVFLLGGNQNVQIISLMNNQIYSLKKKASLWIGEAGNRISSYKAWPYSFPYFLGLRI